MKRFYLLSFCIFNAWVIMAQEPEGQGVGIGTTNVAPDAALEIQSDAKGLLIPRMSDTLNPSNSERAAGLLIYNTTENALYRYDGSWERLIHTGSEADVSSVTASGDITSSATVTGSTVSGTNVTASSTVSTVNLTATGAVSSTGDVSTNGEFIGNGTIPKGGIIMWSGTTVPTGWALCDGSGGRPDLTDRFIMGGSSAQNITGSTVTVSNSTTEYSSAPSGCSNIQFYYSGRYKMGQGCRDEGSEVSFTSNSLNATSCYNAAQRHAGCTNISIINCDRTTNPDYYVGNPNCRVAARYYQLAFIMRVD